MPKRSQPSSQHAVWRFYLVLIILLLILGGIFYRLIDLGVFQRGFLLKQSQARILRVATISGNRGMIIDRHGVPLAISTPVSSIWVNPQLFKIDEEQLKSLSAILKIKATDIKAKVKKANRREFIYLKRQISPPSAEKIKALDIPGVFSQDEFKRFYPEGEVMAHVVGLTNIDDKGQEGLELAYDSWLKGQDGRQKVIKDRMGHIVDNLELLRPAKEGKSLTLSIDNRIQYVAYEALKEAVKKYHAKSGSVIVLDSKTGEILADVNQPTYNPNNRGQQHSGAYRNRALTDTFEPGSTLKPFTIAMALLSGKYTKETTVDTNPGRMKIGGYEIKDDGLNYGVINLTQVLQKSSNIGAAKIMLSLSPRRYWDLLRSFNFGMRTTSGYPGEAIGKLIDHTTWYSSDIATLAYGYGIAVTTLQLAAGYQVLANDGNSMPITFLKREQLPPSHQVLSKSIANSIMQMLQTVVERGGTGTRASVPGYHIAGKTGTAYIASSNGYDKQRFISSFVGAGPVTDPRLVIAVVIREPQGQHFGGLVAAPIFSKIMGSSLRMLSVKPDKESA